MTDREFPPPPCENKDGHYMIPVTDHKTWRCTHCPAVRFFGNRTIHAQEPAT